LINTLCDTALLAAFALDHTTVSLEDLEAAITELQWVEHSTSSMSQRTGTEDDTATHMQPPIGRLVLSLRGAVVTESLLAPGRFVIGRTGDNDLQVDSKFVSRHHAQIVTTRDGSSIEDLNSTNGIFVRGKRIRRSKLNEGDVVKIGVHELIYQRIDGLDTAVAAATQTLEPEE
jgi:pSer/pThr/pTyr-binding forkhead associated (FHA) protein